jgi:outer membrane lipoprotein-sorting protein
MTARSLPPLLALALLPLASRSGDAPPAFLRGDERAEFLRRIEERMAAVRSLAVEFEQEKKLRLFKETVTSRGILLFAAPDRLRWETREPFRSILVVAGNEVAKFEYLGGERKALKLGRGADAILLVMDRIRAWFQGKFDREGTYYEVDVVREPRPRLVLRPRDEAIRKRIRSMELDLSPDLSRVDTVTLTEGEGDRTVLRFKEVGRNPEFPAGTFSVADPRELGPADLPTPPRPTPPAPTSPAPTPGKG